jgi:biopolymer transport protein ExbD
MAIHRPASVLLRGIPLKFVAARVGGSGKKSLDVSITLVPFIDLLISLVVFLLASFSATGDIGQPVGLRMPSAEHAEDLELAPVITVDARMVTLDGRRVADTSTVAQTVGLQRIEQLVGDLERTRANWALLHASQPFPGRVIIQADRSIDFAVIKQVMFSAAQAGFTGISFAVNRSGGA